MRDAKRIISVIKSQQEASKRGALTIWTVYDRPTDFPHGYIARRFEAAGQEKATDDTLTGELEELRQIFLRAGLYKIERDPGDDRHIVESWI